ncbi:MAG: DUF5399 family protein [Parachlamydiales bacterium]|nr:DUF5399 family protein [Parachlamydiales bacterium]
MSDAKTVDNLGPEVHNRYMQDISLLSEKEVQKFLKTPSVASRTEILKIQPSYPELDLLWGLSQNNTTPFAPPANYFIATTDIFTYQLMPSFGPVEEIVEKLDSFVEEKKKRKKRENKEDQEEQKESEKLLKFAKMVSILNKIISEIKKRKDEYHKG